MCYGLPDISRQFIILLMKSYLLKFRSPCHAAVSIKNISRPPVLKDKIIWRKIQGEDEGKGLIEKQQELTDIEEGWKDIKEGVVK